MIKRAILGALGALLLCAAAAPVTVRRADIDAENAWWRAMGVKLPPGGIVLRHPYSPPYSNRSFVVPFSWYRRYYRAMRANHDYPVRASDLRADLPVLRLLMEKAYAGYPTASARGWQWGRWFHDWDSALAREGAARVPIGRAFAPWGALERFQLDNHSGVVAYQAFNSGSLSAVLARPPRGACTALITASGSYPLAAADKGQQPHAVREWSGAAFSPAWYVSYPKRDGEPRALRCGSARIALRAAAQVSVGGTASYETIAPGIAYVRMPAFNDANDSALQTALTKAQGLGKERVVIFDLRGNDGGNAPIDVLNNWVAESAVEQSAETPQYGTQSCFVTALSFGLQQQLAAGLKPPAAPGVTQFLQRIAGTLAGPSNCNVVPEEQQSEVLLKDHRFSIRPEQGAQPRLLAIVDAGCGSDCEFMAKIIAGLPDSVLAGTSTYGVMGFTQPGYFVLPHSRVPFRLALSRTDAYGDGRSVDGYGISVDVLLPSAQSQSRASLLALANALAP